MTSLKVEDLYRIKVRGSEAPFWRRGEPTRASRFTWALVAFLPGRTRFFQPFRKRCPEAAGMVSF